MMSSQDTAKLEIPAEAAAGETNVARRAYEIWEREGRPHGRDKEHWHVAEREVARAQGPRPGAAGSEPGRAGAASAVSGGSASTKSKAPRARKPASPTP